MKVSYEWLQELLPGLQASPAAVAEQLTFHSFETTVLRARKLDPKIIVVRIEKLESHPNADRLRLATVSTGKVRTRVICGAPNIKEGDVVPFSPPGTTLLDENGQLFELKVAKIRGEESPGMLNSLRELGLGTSHSGIFILPAATPLGSALVEHIPDDTILEAEVTNNRAHDCLSHLGIAREVGALLDLPVKMPAMVTLSSPTPIVDGFSLAIEEGNDLVARYNALLVTSLHNGPSPLWLQARLLALEVQPKNFLVDVTNYVMFELGNPAHAFDAERLPGKQISVRHSRENESLTLLNTDTTQTLPADTPLITADDQAVAIAGIVGGSKTAVGEQTSNILVEIANFTAFPLQQAMVRLGLRTEAGVRFSKKLDPSLIESTAARLQYLLQHIAGGVSRGGLEYYPRPPKLRPIAFDPAQVSKLAGTDFTATDIKQSLEAQRFTIDASRVPWQIQIPPDRLDIQGEYDVVEEILRIIGLENIPAKEIKSFSTPVALPRTISWREAVRDVCVKWGLTEMYNYSFANETLLQKIGVSLADPLGIINPPAPELKYLRQSLLPGLLQNVYKNKGEFRIQKLFEIGTVFSRGNGGVVPGVREKMHLAGAAVVGEKGSDNFIKMFVTDGLLPNLGITDVTREHEISDLLGQHTILRHRRKRIGQFGLLKQEIGRKLKFESPVAVFEVDLGALIALATNDPPYHQIFNDAYQYQPFSKFPPVWRDISLLVSPGTRIETVQEVIESIGGKLVADVDLFDVYQPSPEAAGGAARPDESMSPPMSLAFHIKYQAADRTLTDSEVAAVHNRIVSSLQEDLAAVLRE